jgi:hypothetical protein
VSEDADADTAADDAAVDVEANVDEPGDDQVVVDTGDADEDAAVEAAAVEDVDGSEQADDASGSPVEARDDVVVDLFARLRADASLVAVDDELVDDVAESGAVESESSLESDDAVEAEPMTPSRPSPTATWWSRPRRSTSATPSSLR